jgi:peptidoglycan/LPS O-acetylase OafA/YrhL
LTPACYTQYTMAKKTYLENLDGLRFLCFLSVFFFHSAHTEYDYIKADSVYTFIKKGLLANGNLGVNFFFVLSGFLITYLLILEKNETGFIHVRNFWLRRILRIWPLFYLCVLFGFYAFPALKSAFGQQPNETASIEYYLTFTNNFDFIYNGLPDSSVLSVLWSVAIEEQFYLVWPIILSVVPIRKYWVVFVSVMFVSLVFRAFNRDMVSHEHHTLSCIGDMAVGALAAWLILTNSSFKMMIEHLPKIAILLVYLCFGLLYLFRDELLSQNLPLINILEQCFSEKSFFKMSSFPILTKLGRISYGLYCLHSIGLLVTATMLNKLNLNTTLWQVLLLDTSISLLITILISALSYRFYEKPFLKIKEQFAYYTRT